MAKGDTMRPAAAVPHETPLADIPRIVEAARVTFNSGKTKSIAWRVSQLNALVAMVQENKDAMTAALQSDLHRPTFECVVAEVLTLISEAQYALAHLSEWTAREDTATPPALLPGASWIQPEPLGVVCIIGPWNYPLQLMFVPLVAVIAAGNCAVLKPSEVAPACAALTASLLTRYLDNDAIRVVQGAVPETSELLKCRFDHILYTGNGAVAQLVLRAASVHLTPCTLELGGKSPVIVARDADLNMAAKRIVWGKCMNAGQTCIAPDYILVEDAAADGLVSAISSTLLSFYGKDPKASADLGRIVNSRHWSRVTSLLKSSGGTVVAGGDSDASELWVAPTVIKDPSLDAPIMKEEIFGPLLPIVTVKSVAAAIAFVTERPKPLALYVFSSSSATQKAVLAGTSSGGVVVNDVIMHNTNPTLPFGGVGPSGIGSYHGKWGFLTFSHRKPVYQPSSMIDTSFLRMPPYSASGIKRVEWAVGSLPWLPQIGLRDVIIGCLTAAVIALAVKVSGH